ncbi:adenylyl-sulfate kinase [Pseudofrankia saprophytica]|uniref:adenylyl-sulfate kinase n=1 Tax=Pseudofrankia saprophytica TaxID=298655 RepID=UPI000234C020|nr:adenylyl-sulfate kinase [Pseudofrankia saprophytica]
MSATTRTPDGSPGIPSGPLRLVGPDRAAELTAASRDWPSLTLTLAQLADLELLLLGTFGPVPGYAEETLRDGLRMPVLVVSAETAAGVAPGDSVALRDPEGVMIAALRVGLVRQAGATAQPGAVAGGSPGATRPPGAPGEEAEVVEPGQVRLAGRIEGLRLPRHPDYPGLRPRPDELRALLRERDWFQPGGRPPWAVWADGLLHTADIARIRALTRQGKRCVVLAPMGGADPADPRHHLRVRALRAALDALDAPIRPTEATLAGEAIAAEATRASAAVRSYPPSPAAPPTGTEAVGGQAARAPDAQPAKALLVLVPVAPSAVLAAPREPGITATSPFGAPTGADPGEPDRLAELSTLRAHVAEFYGLGGSITGPALGAPGREELGALLAAGRPIPAELTPPGVAAQLARAYPPRHARGLTVLFTGLSGSGKSTLAGLLAVRLLERGDRHVTLLDGDVVRAYLSEGLGFSRADREAGMTRIGFVAAEVAAAGGIAICAPIAPHAAPRARVRELVAGSGAGFVLVHVSTPLDVCEDRDREGLYAKARAGVIPEFPGISDPYEEPADAEVTVDTARVTPDAAVDSVLTHLRAEGWLLA